VIILKSAFGPLGSTVFSSKYNDGVRFPAEYRPGAHPTFCLLGAKASVHLTQVSSLPTCGTVLRSPYVFMQYGDS